MNDPADRTQRPTRRRRDAPVPLVVAAWFVGLIVVTQLALRAVWWDWDALFAPFEPQTFVELPWDDAPYAGLRLCYAEGVESLKGAAFPDELPETDLDLCANARFVDHPSATVLTIGDKRFVWERWEVGELSTLLPVVDTLLSPEHDRERGELHQSTSSRQGDFDWRRENGTTKLRVRSLGRPTFRLEVCGGAFELGADEEALGEQHAFGSGRTVFLFTPEGELASVHPVDTIDRLPRVAERDPAEHDGAGR